MNENETNCEERNLFRIIESYDSQRYYENNVLKLFVTS